MNKKNQKKTEKQTYGIIHQIQQTRLMFNFHKNLIVYGS